MMTHSINQHMCDSHLDCIEVSATCVIAHHLLAHSLTHSLNTLFIPVFTAQIQLIGRYLATVDN